MEYQDITETIIGCAYKVHNTLGFLESVYKKAMVIELTKSTLKVEEEKSLKVYYDNEIVGDFYVDLLAEDEIVIELKSVENLTKAHACPVQFTSVTEQPALLPNKLKLSESVLGMNRNYNTRWDGICKQRERRTGVFIWGSSVGQLPERHEKGNRPSHKLRPQWRRNQTQIQEGCWTG